MDGDPGLPHTEVRPTPGEPAGDEDASQYEPTSRANSQVARELIRKGRALSSQGPGVTVGGLGGLVLDLLLLLDQIGIGMVTSSCTTPRPTSQGETLCHSP